LRAGGTLVCGSLLAVQWPALAAAARLAAEAQASGRGFEHLGADEARDLEAMAARIIPEDEAGPGARSAGVIWFMDAALGGFMAASADDFRSGLSAFAAGAAEAHGGRRFAELTDAAQDEWLRSQDRTDFFARVHFLTLAGMFALPDYGGNRDYAGWRLLGFEHRHAWAPPFGHYDAAAREADRG
jgi:gluconate 2-dehydrogenase gamma chain